MHLRDTYSFLFLDASSVVVDSALEVIDAYHDRILKLEHDVLLKPSMKIVRSRTSPRIVSKQPHALTLLQCTYYLVI